jgi:hypothetical protein
VIVAVLKDWPVAPLGVVPSAKVTLVPDFGFPLESVTVTTNGLVKAVPTVPLWLLPEV